MEKSRLVMFLTVQSNSRLKQNYVKIFSQKVYLMSIQRIVMRMVIVRISFVRKRSK